MFNIKLEEKLYKMSFKALPVKPQWSKNRHGGRNVWGAHVGSKYLLNYQTILCNCFIKQFVLL